MSTTITTKPASALDTAFEPLMRVRCYGGPTVDECVAAIKAARTAKAWDHFFAARRALRGAWRREHGFELA